MGSHVIVTEVDPMRALEAAMDGFEVLPMARPPRSAISSDGDRRQGRDHAQDIKRMKDGAILSNTGHFDVEIDKPALRALAVETRRRVSSLRSSRWRTGGGSTSSRKAGS